MERPQSVFTADADPCGEDEFERLRRRIEALERIERNLFDESDASARDVGARDRTRTLRARLEAENEALYAELRDDIRRSGRSARLLEWLPALVSDVACAGSAQSDRYDLLDDLVGGLLQLEPPACDVAVPADERVFYQPTPARHVFDLIARSALDERDVLVDLGSGMGHVTLLVSICTLARTVGIEIEPAYVDSARRCAERLNLTRAAFVQCDARQADFSTGNIFYLYTPFTGTILRSVLDALAQQAQRRRIRVCTLGPCTTVVAREAWLDVEGSVDPQRISVFRSGAAQLARERS
ncbi:MAG: class I SAM-dependent methyltransferase [Rudaea sp.]